MGVNTKAILRKGTTLEQIYEKLSGKYDEVNIESTSLDYFFIITFKDELDYRRMSVFFGNTAAYDYQIDGVLCDLNLWGNSVEIMNLLLEEFGGYILKNDSSDDEWTPINLEKFEQAGELSQQELFKMKIIQSLGYSNLNKTMKLFEEFSSLTTK